MRESQVWGVMLLGTLGVLTGPRLPLTTPARADELAKVNSELDENQPPSWIARFFADDDRGPRWRVRAKKEKDRLEKERLENESAKTVARKQGDRSKTQAKKSDELEAKESKRDQNAEAVKREQTAYLRRLAVCDQLREVAVKNNDENLNRQADELQAEAWAIYSKHVTSFSTARTPAEDEKDESRDTTTSHGPKAGKSKTKS